MARFNGHSSVRFTRSVECLSGDETAERRIVLGQLIRQIVSPLGLLNGAAIPFTKRA